MTEQPVTPSFDQLAAAEALAAGGGQTGGSQIDSLKVYVGEGAQLPRVQKNRETVGQSPVAGAEGPKFLTVGEVSTDYFRFYYETRQNFISALKGIGQDTTKMTDADFAQAWRAYTIQAAQHTTNGRNMTTWGAVALDLFTREDQRRKEVQKPPETVTSTYSSVDTASDVNLSTRLDAKAMLYQASKTLLGRAPTDTETNNFFTNLNQQEMANPQTTTTTANRTVTATEGVEGGPGPSQTEETTQDRITSGGMSADAKQMLVQEEAKKNPEYGAYQVATTFLDGLMGAVYGKGY